MRASLPSLCARVVSGACSLAPGFSLSYSRSRPRNIGHCSLAVSRYSCDVRLVWAPEADSAFFGGDADNFEYPRYCLDACLFRVYENDKPAVIEDYLKWNSAGPKEGELIFVSGNPGSTSRIFTTDALKYQRDIRMPDVLDFIRRREILLQQFSLGSPEKKRRASRAAGASR